MSAFHIVGYNRIKLDKLLAQEPSTTEVHVYQSVEGKRCFFVLGNDISPINSLHNYIKDTGMGHSFVPDIDRTLRVVNRIQIKNGVVIGSINSIGLSSAHSVKVFK